MKQAPLTVRRWTRVEYERLVGIGMLDRDPVELIDGQLVVAEPQGSYHASRIGAIGDALRAALPSGWLVRVQMPLALDDESEPEPHLAVVPGGVTDYWIVNLVDRVLEVYRDPVPDSSARHGWRYRTVESFTGPAVVSLRAVPSARLALRDLLR